MPILVLVLLFTLTACAQSESRLLGEKQAQTETAAYLAARVPILPTFSSRADWERYSRSLRERILREVVIRGQAESWRRAQCRVEWLPEMPAGPGYRMRPVRFEAIPGLWIPAILYSPATLTGRVPVVLNVKGHERSGIDTPYIQQRSIHLARNGVLALTVDWFGFGQLAGEGFRHAVMPQIDLTGTSGVAVFFLSLERSVDLALSLPNADANRIAVTGLSGGGWQTIFLAALDERIKLAHPVAGYSSYVTRTQMPLMDLGDAEQTPSDLAAVADYTHLTAMAAPRPLLITKNANDTCCFRADYAPGPLLQAARPVYSLLGAPDKLAYFLNQGPGHNYDRDTREAFYRFLGEHFLNGKFVWNENVPESELKTAEQLRVPLPEKNLDFHQIAQQLATGLPRKSWSDAAAGRKRLRELLKVRDLPVQALPAGEGRYRLLMDRAWTVPLTVAGPRDATRTLAVFARDLAPPAGTRVVRIDPFFYGESNPGKKDWLYAILLASLGERPVGLQAAQTIAAARWLQAQGMGPVEIAAEGRETLLALTALALDEGKAIRAVRLREPVSLREAIARNWTVDRYPEWFAFGLLAEFDIDSIRGLCPRDSVHSSW